jgi:FKBP-type peptidyl-prolyl cis-trans isomerase
MIPTALFLGALVLAPGLDDETTTASGLKYQDLQKGTGKVARKDSEVTVHFTGRFADGTTFASSRDGNEPFTFRLGAGQVIAGWEEGIAGMKAGGKRKLVIPPRLAYGSRGAGKVIPPDATLIFVVEAIEVK